jgi:mono/diheme cytochrome c family protein
MQEKGLDGKEPVFLSGAELDGWYASNLRGLPPEEVTALLKTGRSRHAAVAGPMSEVVTHSTQYLSDGDLNTIAVYLRSLAPETAAKAAAPATQADNPGGNATVTADNPLTALRVVLEGAHTPITQQAMAFDMPAYGWALNDRQAADLMSYLRGSWGNQAAPVTVQQVQDARQLQAK